eukprot:jgi/Botrbrau1/6149/Bobra.331_2s0039.1
MIQIPRENSVNEMPNADEDSRWEYAEEGHESKNGLGIGHYTGAQGSDPEAGYHSMHERRVSGSPNKDVLRDNWARGISGSPLGRAAPHERSAECPRASSRAQAEAFRDDPDNDDSNTESEDEEALQAKQKAFAQRHAKPAPKKRATTGKPRAGGGISLRVLIEEGELRPGNGVLSVEYKGFLTHADLAEDGRIVCVLEGKEAQVFESPSAFSIFVKRLVNPSRKADDGWKTVKYDGKFLEHYKMLLLKRRSNDAPGENGLENYPPAAKRARVGQGANHSSNGHVGSTYNRPRRQTKVPQRLGASLSDLHAMVTCQQYEGVPGSGSRLAQPFEIRVSTAALLMMDFHSHLSLNEVIGILKGTWDPEQRLITVVGAIPVRELGTEDDRINVEMDAEDEYRVRQAIEREPEMRVVGWYHSHPQFPAMPSLIDLYNQVNQQHAHRSTEHECEPFIGAIVGPYDRGLRDPCSEVCWYFVKHELGRVPQQGAHELQDNPAFLPMALQVETYDGEMADTESWPISQADIEGLAKRYAGQPTRAEMDELWRGPVARLDKLKSSLSCRMPSSRPPNLVKEFLANLDAVIRTNWAVLASKAHAKMQIKQHDDEEDPEISELTGDAGGASDANLKDDATNRKPGWDGMWEDDSDDLAAAAGRPRHHEDEEEASQDTV